MKSGRGVVRVKVVARSGRANFVFRWIDPATGKQREQNSGTPAKRTLRRIAERAAAELEQQLTSAAFDARDVSWVDFCNRYGERLQMRSLANRRQWATVERLLTRAIAPAFLSDIDAPAIFRFADWLRRESIKSNSIGTYIRITLAAMRWAESAGMIATAPRVDVGKLMASIVRLRRRLYAGVTDTRRDEKTPENNR